MSLVESRWSFAVSHWQAYEFAERLTTIGQGLGRKGQAGGKIPAAVSFPMASREAGRHRRFHLHPQGWFSLRTVRNPRRKAGKEKPSLAAPARVYPKAEAVGNSIHIIDAPGEPMCDIKV